MRFGFLPTDVEDYQDKLLLRVWGFTVFGITGGRESGFWNITILGFWIEWEIRERYRND